MSTQDRLVQNAVVRILSIQSPHDWPRDAHHTAKISDLLVEAFTEKDLKRFCRDCEAFGPVVRRLGSKYSLQDIADEIIDYTRTHLLWHDLLNEVRKKRPYWYELRHPYEKRAEELMEWIKPTNRHQPKKKLEWPIEDEVLSRALAMSQAEQYDLFESRTHDSPFEGFSFIAGTGVFVHGESGPLVVSCVHSVARAHFFSSDHAPDCQMIKFDIPAVPPDRRRVREAAIVGLGCPPPGLANQYGDGAIAFGLVSDAKLLPQPVEIDDVDEMYRGPVTVLGFNRENRLTPKSITATVECPSPRGSVRIVGNDRVLTLPGFAGAPVLNGDNKLVGINVAGYNDSGERVAFMIPSTCVQRAWCGQEGRMAPVRVVPHPPPPVPPSSPSDAADEEKDEVPQVPLYEVDIPDAAWREFLNVSAATSALRPSLSPTLVSLQKEVSKVIDAKKNGRVLSDLCSMKQQLAKFEHDLTDEDRKSPTVQKLEQLVAVLKRAVSDNEDQVQTAGQSGQSEQEGA